MKKHSVKLIAAVLMAAAALGSCTKGDTGATGPQGSTGSNGTNGTNGNANVHAYTFTVNPSDWYSGSPAGFYYCDITFAAITSDIVSTGTVSMFKEGNSGVCVAVPYTEVSTSGETFYWGFNFSLGSCRVFVQDGAMSSLTFPSSYNYKAVVIASSQRRANPNVNWNDYNQVMNLVSQTDGLKTNNPKQSQ